MKKVLIIYNYILHYRVPFFNELSKYYEVTVLHSGKETKNAEFEELIVPVKNIGPFYFQSGVLKEVRRKKYDVIVLLFDVRWINTIISIFTHSKKAKVMLWGAWITDNFLANKARLYLTKITDASIFYTDEARRDFIERGVNDKKLYVANNTFDVGERVKSYEHKVKNRILFVGSLDKRKQLDLVINAFFNIQEQIPENINLTIIGAGKEREKLEEIVKSYKLENRVLFLGKITDNNILRDYYKESIVSVSFGQAGLSVLQSLGYGMPFLTKKNAISGGEKTNIKNNLNSIFCEDNIESLELNLIKLCTDIDYARKLGENAYHYYSKFCTIENMVQGFRDAIDDTQLSKIDSST